MEKIKIKAVVKRGEPVRQSVLDAAERLLRQGKAEFSMRDLATDAGVSFATPFNHFGSKAGVMRALSGRRIDEMEARYRAGKQPRHAKARVLLAIEAAADVMRAEPSINRAVMSWLGAAAPDPGHVLERSCALWRLALGDGAGLATTRHPEALVHLPRQLAFMFRGVLSFWTAGEIDDDQLARYASEAATTLLEAYED